MVTLAVSRINAGCYNLTNPTYEGKDEPIVRLESKLKAYVKLKKKMISDRLIGFMAHVPREHSSLLLVHQNSSEITVSTL